LQKRASKGVRRVTDQGGGPWGGGNIGFKGPAQGQPPKKDGGAERRVKLAGAGRTTYTQKVRIRSDMTVWEKSRLGSKIDARITKEEKKGSKHRRENHAGEKPEKSL